MCMHTKSIELKPRHKDIPSGLFFTHSGAGGKCTQTQFKRVIFSTLKHTRQLKVSNFVTKGSQFHYFMLCLHHYYCGNMYI